MQHGYVCWIITLFKQSIKNDGHVQNNHGSND